VRRLRNMGNHLSYARMYHEAADCIEALVADRDRCRDACDDDLSDRLQMAERTIETLRARIIAERDAVVDQTIKILQDNEYADGALDMTAREAAKLYESIRLLKGPIE